MEPNKESQWTWPDTPAYQKAYREGEMELAETHKWVNRLWLAFGITIILLAGMIILAAIIITSK